MKILKLKKIILPFSSVFIVLCILFIFSITPTATTTTTRYEKIQESRMGYEGRAVQAGIEGVQLPKNILKGNKDSIDKSLLKKDRFIDNQLLKNGEKIIKAEFVTYEEFINTSSADLETYIDKDRIVFVAVVQYPNGFDHPRLGLIENAEVTSYYDAETGEVIGNGVKSLNKDFKIKRPESQLDFEE